MVWIYPSLPRMSLSFLYYIPVLLRVFLNLNAHPWFLWCLNSSCGLKLRLRVSPFFFYNNKKNKDARDMVRGILYVVG